MDLCKMWQKTKKNAERIIWAVCLTVLNSSVLLLNVFRQREQSRIEQWVCDPEPHHPSTDLNVVESSFMSIVSPLCFGIKGTSGESPQRLWGSQEHSGEEMVQMHFNILIATTVRCGVPAGYQPCLQQWQAMAPKTYFHALNQKKKKPCFFSQ